MPPDFQPYLEGELVILRPLQPEDWDELYAVASDPLIWEQHPARDRWQQDVFRKFFDDALHEATTGKGGAFAVIDKATGRIIGSTRFHGYDPHHPDGPQVEIGWTFLARSHWGGRHNRDMKRLMLDHAFKFVERAIFLVGVNNIRSQKAMERIGGVRCGIVENTNVDGKRSQHVKFVIRRPM